MGSCGNVHIPIQCGQSGGEGNDLHAQLVDNYNLTSRLSPLLIRGELQTRVRCVYSHMYLTGTRVPRVNLGNLDNWSVQVSIKGDSLRERLFCCFLFGCCTSLNIFYPFNPRLHHLHFCHWRFHVPVGSTSLCLYSSFLSGFQCCDFYYR